MVTLSKVAKKLGAAFTWIGRIASNSTGSGGGGSDTPSWETFAQSAGDRIIYVSSSGGNDAYDGFEQVHTGVGGALDGPKRTLAAGIALLRNGYADWLLLKKGDTWNEAFGTNWRLSGRSSAQKMLIGSYGTGARPKVNSGTVSAFGTNPFFYPAETYAHVAMSGIELTSTSYSGTGSHIYGIAIFGQCDDFLFEDLYIHNIFTGVVVQGYPSPARHTNIVVRGCMIEDCYFASTVQGDNCQGIYTEAVDGITVEWCTFWNCGWIDEAYYTPYRKAIYIEQFCTLPQITNNIAAGTDGMQDRPGHIFTGNVSSQNAMSFSIGNGDPVPTAGVLCTFEDNVALEGHAPTGVGVFGVRITNMVGGTIKRNIVSKSLVGASDYRGFWGQPTPTSTHVMENVDFSYNICNDWNGPCLFFDAGPSYYANNTLANNVFQNPTAAPVIDHGQAVQNQIALTSADITTQNCVFSLISGATAGAYDGANGYITLAQWLLNVGDSGSTTSAVSYLDPNRTLGKYYQSLGGADNHDAFMDLIITQSKDTWNDSYHAPAIVAYVKSGFV